MIAFSFFALFLFPPTEFIQSTSLLLSLFPAFGITLMIGSIIATEYERFYICLVYTLVGSLVFTFVGIYLHEVRPTPHLAPKGLLLGFGKSRKKQSSVSSVSTDAGLKIQINSDDTDVTDEANRMELLEKDNIHPENEGNLSPE